jgi:hypothetical protein
LVFDSGLPRTRTARPFCTKIWTAHHCVQPWQVLAIHSPLGGLAPWALRGISAAETGRDPVVEHPAASRQAVAAENWMNERLVSFI